MILTFRYRVKSLTGLLNTQARAVNYVWNYCNDVQKQALKWDREWPTGFDLNKLTAGSCKELRLHCHTVNAACEQYARSRRQHKRPYLSYRGRKSLGWVPLKGHTLRADGDGFVFHGRRFRVFMSRPLPDLARIKDGTNFSQDASGNWFLNIVVGLPDSEPRAVVAGVGIDLGLKDLAALSSGEKIENPRHYQRLEARLGIAQRARKRGRVTALHASIRNARRDHLHKLSTRIIREFDYIAVGNVNAAGLAKTRMAKSVFDASWTSFRNMLAYKAIRHGAWYQEVDESFSSQVCSSCGALPDSRPKGIADLGVRRWTCSDCGARHDRDTNAAINILARCGHAAPIVGIPASWGRMSKDSVNRCS